MKNKIITGTRKSTIRMRKTPIGRFCCTVDFETNEALWIFMEKFLEHRKLNRITDLQSVYSHVMYAIIFDLYSKPVILDNTLKANYRFTRVQALAVLWLLCYYPHWYRNLQLQTLKDELHKLLI